MLEIPKRAKSHLISAVEAKIEREKKISSEPEECWPEDFDLNDLPIYEDILTCLNNTIDQRLDLGRGKHSWFLTMLIPPYVAELGIRLDPAERSALKAVYDQRPVRGLPFPPNAQT